MELTDLTYEQPLQVMHHVNGYAIRPGNPLPFGASLVPGGVNFSIYSHAATTCTLVLFDKNGILPSAEIPIPAAYRVGDVFPIIVLGLDYEQIEYGFRLDGPFDPLVGHRFDRKALILDPYAKAVGGRAVWGTTFNPDTSYRAQIV